MRDASRQRPLIEHLYDVWSQFPDQRLCQFLFNLTGRYDCFFVEDEVLDDALKAVVAGTHPSLRLPVDDLDLHTPDEWIEMLGLNPVMDPDGWRGPNGRPWGDRISQDEFNRRYAHCTLGPKR